MEWRRAGRPVGARAAVGATDRRAAARHSTGAAGHTRVSWPHVAHGPLSYHAFERTGPCERKDKGLWVRSGLYPVARRQLRQFHLVDPRARRCGPLAARPFFQKFEGTQACRLACAAPAGKRVWARRVHVTFLEVNLVTITSAAAAAPSGPARAPARPRLLPRPHGSPARAKLPELSAFSGHAGDSTDAVRAAGRAHNPRSPHGASSPLPRRSTGGRDQVRDPRGEATQTSRPVRCGARAQFVAL